MPIAIPEQSQQRVPRHAYLRKVILPLEKSPDRDSAALESLVDFGAR